MSPPTTMTNHTLLKSAPVPSALDVPSVSKQGELALRAKTDVQNQPRTMLTLLRSLRRCWRRAVAVGLLLGLLSVMTVWIFLPPSKPFAFAKIYFPSNPERTLNEHPDPPLKELTQKERILSRKLLSKVVARPDVAALTMFNGIDDRVAFLARELTIEFPMGTEVMRITLAGEPTHELVAIVNAVKDTYLQEVAEESEKRRGNREAGLRQLLAEAEREYIKAREEARKKSEGIGSGDPATIAFKQQRIENELYVGDGELRILTQRMNLLKRDIDVLKGQLTEPVDLSDPAYEPTLLADEELSFLNRQRKETERRLIELKRLVAADHPSIKETENELKILQSKLADRKSEIRPFIEKYVRQKLTADLAKLKIDLTAEERQELVLNHKIDKLNGEARALINATLNVEGSSRDLQRLKDEKDELEKILKRRLSERDAPIRAGTLEDAIVVYPDEASRRVRFAGIGFAAVFALTLIGFGLSEYRSRRIESASEVVEGLGMPVMGTVPAKPARITRAALASPYSADQVLWERLIEESVDSARTIFLHAADANALRVVQVTSAVGSEGKTSLSCQLAKSLARSGRRVLLIDGDLRSPAVNSHFAIPIEPGVCEVLRREASAATAIRPCATPNLFLLPAGRCEKLALQQLAMDGFRNLIAEVRNTFDFVLIDSCPVLPVADALLMAREADGVLLSLMCDISQIERVQTACHKLTAIGARIVGAVLQGTGKDSYDYGPRYLMPYTQPSSA
jgi:capsular exopolysaccharide synthesis family protein